MFSIKLKFKIIKTNFKTKIKNTLNKFEKKKHFKTLKKKKKH